MGPLYLLVKIKWIPHHIELFVVSHLEDPLPNLITASSRVEGGCRRCPGASTVINQPLDSKTLLWLAIPTTQPLAPTQGHPGTRHAVITVERGKKRRGIGMEAEKSGKRYRWKNNRLKKSKVSHNALPNLVLDSLSTETAWPTWACARMPETADR